MTSSMTFEQLVNKYLLHTFYGAPTWMWLENRTARLHLAQPSSLAPDHLILYQIACCAVMHIYAQHVIENISPQLILLKKTTKKDQEECQVQMELTEYKWSPYHMSQAKPQIWVTSQLWSERLDEISTLLLPFYPQKGMTASLLLLNRLFSCSLVMSLHIPWSLLGPRVSPC